MKKKEKQCDKLRKQRRRSLQEKKKKKKKRIKKMKVIEYEKGELEVFLYNITEKNIEIAYKEKVKGNYLQIYRKLSVILKGISLEFLLIFVLFVIELCIMHQLHCTIKTSIIQIF